MSKRIDWIDVAKGIAIILVVMGHVMVTYLNNDCYKGTIIYEFGVKFIYSFHMPLFMLISGVLIGNKLNNSNINKGGVRTFRSYFIPYLFFSVFWWAYKFFLSASGGVEIKDLLLILLYPISFLWFIYALLIMVLFQYAIGLPKQRYQYLHLLVAFSILYIRPICSEYFTSIRFEDLVLNDIMRTYFYFLLGVYLSGAFLNLHKIGRKGISLLCTMIILIGGNILQYQGMINGCCVFSIIIALAGSVFTLLLSTYLRRSNIMQYIGRISLAIYMLQNLGIIISKRSLGFLLHGISSSGYIELLVGTFVGCTIPVLIYFCCTKVWRLDFVFNPNKYIK